MSLKVGDVEIEKVIVVRQESGEVVELDKLKNQYGDVIFEKLSGLILYVERNTGLKDFQKVGMRITAGNSSAFVTYSGLTREIPPNTTQDVVFGVIDTIDDGTNVEGEYVVSGDYSNIKLIPTPEDNVSKYLACVTKVIQIPNKYFDTTEFLSGAIYCGSLITIPEALKNLGNNAFNNLSFINQSAELVISEGIESIGDNCFTSAFLRKTMINDVENYYLTIPSTVKSIGKLALRLSYGNGPVFNFVFKQPSGMDVALPAAGSSSGMVYYKSSRNFNIYTDNETIKNYDWASDNANATLYHLDGTLWE